MSPDFTARLAALRAAIDTLDSELIGLLRKRIGIIHEVAALKAEHTPAACHIRPGREGEMHKRIFGAFEDSDFPPVAALTIWRQIIGASTNLESPITIAVAGENTELRWHGREYFGRNVSFVQVKDIEAALKAVDAKQATIALLPAPTDANLNEWAKLEKHASLKAFASLPVVLAPNEKPVACAVAAVAPESSGDDMSLVLVAKNSPHKGDVLAENATHKLIGVPGVVADSLGTLPTPLTDPTLKPWN